MVKNLISISFVCLCYNLNAQTSNSQLLYQHFGVNENQSELNYISRLLEANNLTIAGPNQEKAITEAHNFYLSHKEEIDMNLKAEELVLFRSIVKKATKEAKAAAWTQALESFVTNFSGALSAAQQQQNIDLQKKLNKEIEIQSVLARHSTSAPKQYTQNFGSTPVDTITPKSPRVTTSYGLEEPLPSAKSFVPGTETETMGIIIEKGVRKSIRLKVIGNSLEAMWHSDDPLEYVGNKSWVPVGRLGDNTDYKSDGELSKMYKYRVTLDHGGVGYLTTIYF